MSRRAVQFFVVIVVVALFGVPARATPPNPVVSSVFAPIERDIIEPGTSNTLHLTARFTC